MQLSVKPTIVQKVGGFQAYLDPSIISSILKVVLSARVMSHSRQSLLTLSASVGGMNLNSAVTSYDVMISSEPSSVSFLEFYTQNPGCYSRKHGKGGGRILVQCLARL